MAQAAQVVLNAANPFTTNPSFTYFETEYPDTQKPPLAVAFEVPFDNQQANFGTTDECTLPAYGDILTGVFLKATLPPIYTPPPQTWVFPQSSNVTSFSLYTCLTITSIVDISFPVGTYRVTTLFPHFLATDQIVLFTINTSSLSLFGYVYSISSANSFIFSNLGNTLISYNISASQITRISTQALTEAPIVSYYSTQNLNIWATNLVNLPYTSSVAGQLDSSIASFVPGQQVINAGTIYTVATSSGNVFTLVNTSPIPTGLYIVQNLNVTYDPNQNKFVYQSSVYNSIYFTNAQSAAFWGFDYTQGPSFPFVNNTLTSQWNLQQAGWIQGFLPPFLSNYVDGVANKLVKDARVLIGRQVIKKFSGEYLELKNDLMVPYENKAILKLMNGTFDTTQAIAARQYYVPIPLGCENIPLCALDYQQVSIEIDFEQYGNLANNLNPGTGNFFDPKSYTTVPYTVNNSTFGTSGTLQYLNYILFFTFDTNFIFGITSYDTTQPLNNPNAYNYMFIGQGSQGTSTTTNASILGDYVYISTLLGIQNLKRIYLPDFIAGHGTVENPLQVGFGRVGANNVCDGRYVYFNALVTNDQLQSINTFVRYDTKRQFTNQSSYIVSTFNIPSGHTITKFLFTGLYIIALGNSGSDTIQFFYYNINDNFNTWYSFSNDLIIQDGVVLNNSIYFVCPPPQRTLLVMNSYLQITNSINLNFLPWNILGDSFQNLMAIGTTIYASTGLGSTQIVDGNGQVIGYNYYTGICQIDTTKNLSSASAYTYYGNQTGNSPITWNYFSDTYGNPKPISMCFGYSARYVYMFPSVTGQIVKGNTIISYDTASVNPVLQASIVAEYQVLPPGVPKPTSSTIKYIQTQHVTPLQIQANDLQILGPVKEMLITGPSVASNVYQYSNIGIESLTITGHEQILTPDVGTNTYLGTITPFQTHTMMPYRNQYILPFEIDPESQEPNGTINFSRLQYQQVSNGNSIWVDSYNILTVESGLGGLEFNSPY